MPNKRQGPLPHPQRKGPLRHIQRKGSLPYRGAIRRGDSGEFIALVEIDWAAGTEYYSFTSVRTPSIDYLPYVLKISPIRRQVSLYGGKMSIGNCRISLVNSPMGQDRYFSAKLATVNFRGRKVRVKLVEIGDGLGAALTVFEGRINRWFLSSGELTIDTRDTRIDELLGAKLSQTVPVISATTFSAVPDGQVPILTPLVMGRLIDMWATAAGGSAVGFLVDTVGGGGTPYVYLFGARPLSTQGYTPVFYKYGSSTAGTMTTAVYSGTTYGVVKFASDQRDVNRPDEQEITAGINGFTEDDLPASAPILNPVRGLEYLLLTYAGMVSGDFDSGLQTTAKDTAASQGYADDETSAASVGPPFGFFMADPDATWAEVIEKFCETYALQFFTTRDGKLATYVATDDPDGSADFSIDDESDILDNSMMISSIDAVASVLSVKHMFRWPYGRRGDLEPGSSFERRPEYVIPGEKTRIGGNDIQKSIHLWYCRSTRRAMEVARAYAEFSKTQAQWITFDLPIRWYRQVELNRLVSITHWQGVTSTPGYAAAVARIIGIEVIIQPRSMALQLTCFRKASFIQGKDSFSGSSLSSSNWSWVQDAYSVASNQLRTSNPSTLFTNGAIIRTETFGNNQLARTSYAAASAPGPTQGYSGVVVRMTLTDSSGDPVVTGYAAVYDVASNTIKLYKMVTYNLNTGSGTLTLLGENTNVNALDKDLEIRVDGTSIEVWSIDVFPANNGRIIGPITDSAISSGKTGHVFKGYQSGRYTAWKEFVSRDF